MTSKIGLYEYPARKLRWVIRWFGEYDPGGGRRRRYSKSFRLKRDAERFQAAKQAELDGGGRRDRPDKITLAEFCQRFEDTRLRNHSHSDLQCYRNTLGQLQAYFGGDRLLTRIDRQEAEAFISSRVRVDKGRRGQPLSGWSRAQHLKHCRAMWNGAKQWGYVPENVFDSVASPDKSTRPWHFLKPTEFRKLLDVAADARWRTIYWVLYCCGLRFGEAFNLLWGDIDFERGRLHIRNRSAAPDLPPFKVKADGRGGSSKERMVPIPKPVLNALTGWQAAAPEGVPFVLLTKRRFETLTRNWKRCQAGLPREGASKPRPWQNRDIILNVLRDMKLMVRRAGVDLMAAITLHTLRKSFGQNHADNGTPMHVLQHLMGHSSISTTREFYIRVSDESTSAATERYGNLVPESADTVPAQFESDARMTPARAEG